MTVSSRRPAADLVGLIVEFKQHLYSTSEKLDVTLSPTEEIKSEIFLLSRALLGTAVNST